MMSYKSMLFGLSADDLEQARNILERILGVKFRGHRAVDHEVHWRTAHDVAPQFSLWFNAYVDEEGPQFHEPDFHEHEILFEIENYESQSEMKNAVLQATELKPVLLRLFEEG